MTEATTQPRRESPSGLRSALARHGQIALLGGLLGLSPLILLVNVVNRARLFVERLAAPLRKVLPGVELPRDESLGLRLIAFGAVFVACWIFGLFIVRTAFGRSLKDWVERVVLKRTPVFETYRQLTGQSDRPQPLQPALARIGGDWQPAGLVEAGEGAFSTVLVVDVPQLTTGRLYCVPREDVHPLDLTPAEFQRKLKGLGRGATDWHRALAAGDGGLSTQP